MSHFYKDANQVATIYHSKFQFQMRLFSTFLTLQLPQVNNKFFFRITLRNQMQRNRLLLRYTMRSRQAIEGCITIVMFVVSPCHSSLHAIDHDIDMPPLL